MTARRALPMAALLLLALAAGATQCVNRAYGPPCEGIECAGAMAGAPPELELGDDGSTTISDGVLSAHVGADRVVRGLVIDGGGVRVDVGEDGVDSVVLLTSSGSRIKVRRDGRVDVEDGTYTLTDGTRIKVVGGRMQLVERQVFSAKALNVTIGNAGVEGVSLLTTEGHRVSIAPDGRATFEDGTYRLADGTEVRMEGGHLLLPSALTFTATDGSVSVSVGNNGLGEVSLAAAGGSTVRIDASGTLRAPDGTYTVNGRTVQASGGRLPEGTLSLAGGGTAQVSFDVADRFSGRVEVPSGTVTFSDGRPTGTLKLARDGRPYDMTLSGGDGFVSYTLPTGTFSTTFDRRGVVGGSLDAGGGATVRMDRGPLGGNVALSLDLDGQRLTFDPQTGPSGALTVSKGGATYQLDLDRGLGKVQLGGGGFAMSFDTTGLGDASIRLGDGASIGLDLDRGTGTFGAQVNVGGGTIGFDPQGGFSGGFTFGKGDGKYTVSLGGNGVGLGANVGGSQFNIGFGDKGFTGGISFGSNGAVQIGSDGKLAGTVSTPFGTAGFGADGVKLNFGGMFDVGISPDGSMTSSLADAMKGGDIFSGMANNICTPRLLEQTKVGGGGGPQLDPTLTDCDLERTATNLREHTDNLIDDLTRAIEYYTAMVSDLESIKGGLDEWCKDCKQSIQGFTGKGYMPCGGKLSMNPTPPKIASDDGFRPEICGMSVLMMCAPENPLSAWCTVSSFPNPLARACPLCLTLSCVYGHECKIGFPNPAGAAGGAGGGGAGGAAGGAAGGGGAMDALKGMAGAAACAVQSAAGGQQGQQQPQQPRPSATPRPSPTPLPSPQPAQPTPEPENPNPTCTCEGTDEPACGTDGRTYINACIAGCFGIPIAHAGSCEEHCGSDDDCVPDRCCAEGLKCSCINGRCRAGVRAKLAGASSLAPSTPASAGFGGFGVDEDEGWEALAARPGAAELQGESGGGGGGEGASQCIKMMDKTACNSAGAPDTYDVPPPPIGANTMDLGIKGCTTQGAPLMCSLSDCKTCDSACTCTQCPACQAQIMAVEAPKRTPPLMGACTNHLCCGPGFQCTDMNKLTGCKCCIPCKAGCCGYEKAACVPETHSCADVTQATLVTKQKQNSIPSPGGVQECSQNVADLKDVCTVEGSPQLQEGMLDPCAVGERLGRVIEEMHDLIQRMSTAVSTLQEISGRLGYEHGEGYSVRSSATIEAEINAIAAVLEGANVTEDFQRRLANFVRLFQDQSFLDDISADKQFGAAMFGVLPKAEGAPGTGIWAKYCMDFQLCAGCKGSQTPAGCLGPTSKTSYKPNQLDYRGRCMSLPGGTVVSERSFDTWQDRSAVDNFAQIDAEEDLFIDTEKCYAYASRSMPNDTSAKPQANATPAGGESPECTAACRACYGVERAHCHAQLGVCVCEAGSRWLLVSQQCAPPRRASEEEVKCCERLFSVGAEHGSNQTSGHQCAGPIVRGVAVDRCRSASGLCCGYRFEERPLGGSCPSNATGIRSCQEMCVARFSGGRADWCARRCATVDVTCEQSCLDAGGDAACLRACSPQPEAAAAGPAPPSELSSCMESCLARYPDKGEHCVRACRAAAPEGGAEAFVGRPGSRQPNQVLAAGDAVEAGGSVNDTSGAALEGSARLSLVTLSGCSCEGEECRCSEDVKVLREVPLRLAPGEGMAVPPASARAEAADASIQALLEVLDASGTVLLSARSPLAFVVEPGAVAVRDAFFVGAGGRTTEAYPNATVSGAVVLDSAVHPITVTVSLERDGSPLEGTAATHTVSAPTAQPLPSGPYTAGERDLDSVVRIHVSVRDSAGAVLLERTLEEQGLAPGACGERMTAWCLSQLGSVRPSYPSAFAHVRRLELAVRDAAFMDFDGRPIDTVYGSKDAVAVAWVANRISVPFSGRVIATVLDDRGSPVASKEAWASGERALGRGAELAVQVDAFGAKPPQTYSLRLTAQDGEGRTWLDRVVDPAAYPHARLRAAARDPSAPSSRIDTVIGVGSCTIRVSCEGCSPLCELHVDPATCSVAPRDCDCDCVS